MKQKYVNTRRYMARTFILLLGIGFYGGAFVDRVNAQEVLWQSPLSNNQYNSVDCDESAPIRQQLDVDVDLYAVNEVRIPFAKSNVGAGAGSYSNMVFYIDGVAKETVPTFAINWIYHNDTNLIDPDSNNWTKIPLTGSYNVASTSMVWVEYTCSGLYAFSDTPTASPIVGQNKVFLNGGGFGPNSLYFRGSIITLVSGTAPPVYIPGVPLTFSIFPTTTESADLIASVAGGVQETGKAIWPMFAFVGVGLAFIIALQVVVFIKRSVNGGPGGTNGATGDPRASKRTQRRNARGQFIKEE